MAGAEQVSLLLGVEYESVQGQRLLLTPALLAAAVASSLDTVSVRQHAQAAASAARPGPQTAAAAAAAAQTPPASAAAFLLQHDLPLFLQLPGEQLVQLAGSKRRSMPGVSAAGGGDRPSLVWLQLRRVLVGTPDVAVALEAAPQLAVEVPRDLLAPAPSAAGGPPSTSPTTVQLQYSLRAPVSVPPGTFCVLTLPWQLTAPMQGSGGGGPTPTALIRPSGPLRAWLVGSTALQPAAG